MKILEIKLVTKDKTEIRFRKEFESTVNREEVCSHIENFIDCVSTAYGLGIPGYFCLIRARENMSKGTSCLMSTSFSSHYVEITYIDKMNK